MSIVVLKLPDVKRKTEERPRHCPYCQGETFQRWGGAMRQVRDPRIREVLVYRYRCCRCRHTFRHYPSGIGSASQTERMRALAKAENGTISPLLLRTYQLPISSGSIRYFASAWRKTFLTRPLSMKSLT